MWLFTLEIGAEQLRSVTEIASKSRFLCVNRSPIEYGFRAGAKAVRYTMNVTLTVTLQLLETDRLSIRGTQRRFPSKYVEHTF